MNKLRIRTNTLSIISNIDSLGKRESNMRSIRIVSKKTFTTKSNYSITTNYFLEERKNNFIKEMNKLKLPQQKVVSGLGFVLTKKKPNNLISIKTQPKKSVRKRLILGIK